MKWRVYFWLAWIICGSVSALLGEAFEETWPQWRGSMRDGSYEGKAWPRSFKDQKPDLRWTHPLEASYSSPVADLKHLYTTESVDSKTEAVKAFDRASGELLWTQSWQGGMKVPFFAASNGSWIRSTPAVHGGKLYVLGMQERLVCLDTASGEVIWQCDIPERLGAPQASFGGVCSPLVVENALYLQGGGGILKFDATNGNLIWSSSTSDDAMNDSPFASPRMLRTGDQVQLVALGREALMGIHPDSGKLLWQQAVPAFRGMNILTPSFIGDNILTATYGGKAHLFSPSSTGFNEWTVTEKWHQKFQGYMSSPVIVGSFAYLHGRSGRMVCLDTASGAIEWTSTESLGKYCSMVTNGEAILALSDNGNLRMITATPESYSVMDQMDISEEETWAHIGIADNQIFIRSLKHLSVFDWGKQ